MTRHATRRGVLRGLALRASGTVLSRGRPATARAAQSGEGWPRFKRTRRDNAYVRDGTAGVGVVERWRFGTDSAVDSSPAVVDGAVYAGSDDDRDGPSGGPSRGAEGGFEALREELVDLERRREEYLEEVVDGLNR